MSSFSRRSAVVITLFALACLGTRPASAATRNYKVSMKGTSTTLSGQKFKFTGSGNMSVDDATGQLTFNASLSNGTTINGIGLAGVGKNLFANISFTQNGASGIGTITGKASADPAELLRQVHGGNPGPPRPRARRIREQRRHHQRPAAIARSSPDPPLASGHAARLSCPRPCAG